MGLSDKDDWEETKQRFCAWWNHEFHERCALAVYAPKKNPPDLTAPAPPHSPQEKWFDLDWINHNQEYQLRRMFYGGEAIPVWNAGYCGVSAIPAILGCRTDVDMETGWWWPFLIEPDRIDFGRLRLDETQENYRFTMDMLRRGSQKASGKCLISIGAFGGCGDTLAALRGTNQLLLDCIERPEQVYAAEQYLMDLWFDFYDRCFAIVCGANQGSTCWFQLWSPGKFYAAHNDFSYNISTRMFTEIFLPVIRRQTEFLDHSVYHVDGVNAFRHVDVLCELPCLQAIQILPGAGKPSPLYFIDTLKKVQRAGKNLHISISPGEVEAALSWLSARGLFIETWAETEDAARALLRNAERWSVDRG